MNGYGQLGKDLCKRKGKKSWGYIRNCNWGGIEWDIRPMWLIFTLISIPLSVSRDFFQTKGVYPLSMLGFQALNKNNKFHCLHF